MNSFFGNTIKYLFYPIYTCNSDTNLKCFKQIIVWYFLAYSYITQKENLQFYSPNDLESHFSLFQKKKKKKEEEKRSHLALFQKQRIKLFTKLHDLHIIVLRNAEVYNYKKLVIPSIILLCDVSQRNFQTERE